MMESEPTPPRTLNPRVDRDLEALCPKFLEKDPRQRYGSAAELADDPDRWQRGEPTRARPPSSWQAARYWLRQNLRGALCVLVVGLVLGALGSYSVYIRILQKPLIEAVDPLTAMDQMERRASREDRPAKGQSTKETTQMTVETL